MISNLKWYEYIPGILVILLYALAMGSDLPEQYKEFFAWLIR